VLTRYGCKSGDEGSVWPKERREGRRRLRKEEIEILYNVGFHSAVPEHQLYSYFTEDTVRIVNSFITIIGIGKLWKLRWSGYIGQNCYMLAVYSHINYRYN
jgi:hypothetical protein